MNFIHTAKQLQALFEETNKAVKGNWIAPEINEIVKILRENLCGGEGHHEQREFQAGDKVKISPESECSYEVAHIKLFPHGYMVGIYDEPPSKHIDYWKPESLTLVASPLGERSESFARFFKHVEGVSNEQLERIIEGGDQPSGSGRTTDDKPLR